jgi:hypothetical protein
MAMKRNDEPQMSAIPARRPHSLVLKASRFVPWEVVGRAELWATESLDIESG